jgi:predicted TIM-barrel fold metal-dependent hydrolase
MERLPATAFGLPSARELARYRIWDSYFTPSLSQPAGVVAEIEHTLPKAKKAAIERACIFQHVGLGTASAEVEKQLRRDERLIREPLERWPNWLLGMIQINALHRERALEAIERWIADGPMVGVYFAGGLREGYPCSHPNFDPLVERVAELGGLIMQHTWFDTTNKGGPAQSTPSHLAILAGRYPEITFVCAHAGGEWEKGIRAIRGRPNVLIETSGFDPTAGFIDMAVRDLSAQRILFGSHLPSRSLGTELGKVLTAAISEEDKHQILGGNLRRLLGPIMQRKGLSITPPA